MEQDKIWRHYQNNRQIVFAEAMPRMRFLARRVSEGQAVLNVGIGAGLFERIAADRGGVVYALDPDEQSVVRIRDELALGSRAMMGTIGAIPLPDATLDMVCVSEVLEHLDAATYRAGIAEMIRVLKPHGRIIGTVPFREDIIASEIVCPKCGEVFHRWGHVRTFDLGDVRSAFAQYRVHVTEKVKCFVGERRIRIVEWILVAAKSALFALGLRRVSISMYFEITKID